MKEDKPRCFGSGEGHKLYAVHHDSESGAETENIARDLLVCVETKARFQNAADLQLSELARNFEK